MTDLILWRHGQTDYNSQGRIQGQVDVPLNETGRDQARRAAEDIAALGPTRIVSSPLIRARDTAEALASLTGLSVEIDEGLAKDDIIVAVSHGAATNLGATYLLGMDAQQWFGLRGMSNCCYALLRTNKRPPGWAVVTWNAGPPVDSRPLGRILG